MKYADYTQAVNGTNNTSVMTPLRVKQAIQANGGGGSGTSDYTALENKPKINGVTLEGDKSSSDLGISVPSVDEETIIESPNLTAIGVKESSGNVDHFLTLTLSEYNAIENKDPNTFYNITDDTDPSAIPTKTSDLVNDSGFITSSYHDDTKVDKDSIARVNNVVSRNLLNLYNFQSQTINGVTFTKNKDNSITINGTATSGFGVNFVKLKLKAGTYHLSLNETVPNDFYIYDYDTNTAIISNNSTTTLTQDYNNVGFDTWINSGTTFNNVTIYPQLEEGSTATPYTPYLNLEEAMQPKGVTLFDGATGGNVVLSDTPSNYNTLDIYYNVGSTVLIQSIKSNSSYFVLTLSEIDNKVSGNMGIINHYKKYVVNGNTLTVAAAGRLFKYQVDTNVTQDKIDYLWIMKVIGYK